MELPLVLIAGCPGLHGAEHLGELEVVDDLLLGHLHDLPLPLQHSEAQVHLVLLQLALELGPFLPLLQQVDHLLGNCRAVADQLLELGRLPPAQLQLRQVVLLHRVSPQEVQQPAHLL